MAYTGPAGARRLEKSWKEATGHSPRNRLAFLRQQGEKRPEIEAGLVAAQGDVGMEGAGVGLDAQRPQGRLDAGEEGVERGARFHPGPEDVQAVRGGELAEAREPQAEGGDGDARGGQGRAGSARPAPHRPRR